jgi:hypothetical protein
LERRFSSFSSPSIGEAIALVGVDGPLNDAADFSGYNGRAKSSDESASDSAPGDNASSSTSISSSLDDALALTRAVGIEETPGFRLGSIADAGENQQGQCVTEKARE